MIHNDRSVGLDVRLAGPGSVPSVHRIRRVVAGSTPGPGPFACLLPEEVVLLTTVPGLGDLVGHTLRLPATDLRWEQHDVGTVGPPLMSRLVIWSTNGGLSIHEVEQVAGRLNVMECYSMATEELCKRLGFSPEDSRDMDFIKLMHFSSGVVTLLMKHCIVAQLVLLERGIFCDTINHWQMQPCPPCPSQLVNATLMQNSLIALHESGHVYIFDLTTGYCQAHIDIPMYCRVRNPEIQRKDRPKIPFRIVAVSNGLEYIVALDDSKIAVYISLKDYFRIFPEHVINGGGSHEELAADVCSDDADNESIFDEDDICWSLKAALPFNADRSWNVQLTRLQEQQKSSSSLFSGSGFHWLHSQVSPVHLKKPRIKTSLDHLCDCRRDSIQEVSKSVLGLTSISPMTSAHVCFLSVGHTTALLAFTDNGDLTLLLWDISDGSLLPCFSVSPGIVVEMDDEDCPCLILTEQGLSMFILGLSHNELLSRLMVHGSPRLVDSLCLLNHWERCSVPLHALEAGLQNRQLDMLDFFLKSQEHLLDFGASSTQQDSLSSLSLSQLQNVYRLVPALQLLHRLVQESIAKEATNNFAEELLYRTHTFLHRQLRMLLTNYCQDTMPDKRVAECTQVLLGFIKDLRQFFRNITERELWNFSSEVEVDSVTVPQIASWENMSTRDVVKNAIICGCIPAAQAWLKSRRDNCGNLKCLKSLGVELVDAALRQRDMKTTCTLIGNLGFEVSDHLRKVCFYMEDNDLRDFLVETNEDMSFLNREEQEVARFVQHVESLYNLTCHVVQPKTPATIRFGKYKEDCREPSVQCPLVDLLDTPCTLDHEADPMSLAWMLGLDEDVRQKILLDSGRLNDYYTFSADTLWYYLTSHHKQEDVHAWLENWLSGRESQRWPVLCTDIVATNTHCCSFFREEILDHMARKGCFLPSEVSDMYSLVKRLAWTLGFTPQLSKVQNVNEFHGRFVRFCLEIDFPHILSLYLDHYRLNVEQCPELGDTELLKVYPWFNFLISLWQLQDKTAIHVSDVFRASLANGRLLLSNEHGGIESMLLEGHTLLAAASLMYSPGGLDAATLQADEQLMKPALSPYPCLKAALFPQTSGTPCVTDISLYHLLQALDPFGPSRLYGWQATNTFARQDSFQELPNFSQPFLKARPTTCQFLGFSYYLLHGRPSFAFVAFVQEGIQCGGISKSSVQDAGKEASMLALTNFDSPAVVASVVAFAEMLGLDRVMTQVNTRVANTILQNKLAEGGTMPEERQQLVARFLELAHGNTAGFSGVLLDLEEAIKVTLLADGIESSSMDAANRWEMAVQFCQIHGAELSEVFVRECARDNCWLPFITFIHRHHYPVHQVMSVVEDFPSPLREHISLAFSGLLDASVGHEGFNIFRSILDMRQGPRSWQELLQQAVKASIPILCVLATAYPGAEVVPCLCAWILASCECHPAGVDMVGKVANPAQCGLLELSKLLCEGLKRGEVCILITAFQLFLPDTHLLYLLQMFNLCTEHKDYHSAKDKLQAFTRGLDELKALGTHTSLSLPANWLEAQASVLLLILIRKSETQYQTFRLYQLLSESHSVLHSDVLDFKKLSQLAQILRHLDVPLGPAGLQDWGPEGLLLHCVHLVACLQERRYFVQARQVAAVMDLPCDDIVTNELFDGMQVLQEKEQWGYAQVRATFWKQCHEAFDSARTSPSHAASFFAARASEVVIDNSTSQVMTCPVNEPSSRGNAASVLLLHEKLALLTLSGHWLGNGLTTEPSEMEIAEFECWKCRLELQHSLEIGKVSVSSTVDTTEDGNSLQQENYVEQEEGCASFAMLSSKYSFDSHSLLSSPHYLKLSGLSSSNGFCRITNFQEKIFENKVADLLDKGCVLEAARVCHYFGVRFPDLEFALSCLALASCEANVTDLPEHAQDVVQGYSAPTPIPRHRKDSGCSLCSFVIVPSREDQVVVALETLTRACQHGKRFCQQVHNAYELAKELEVDFAEVWNGESASLLTRVLRHENIDRVSRASLFVEIRGISTPTVTHLLADTIVEDLARERAPEGTRLVYLPSEGREAFGKLLKLCSEPAALGTILLQKASSLAGQEPTVMVEVLILAHECFTIVCHVEGIIRTLLLAKHLTHHVLVPRELYPLMVCLLIGIGRYTDMVYILDLLHQYDQFELILKNKMDLDGSLKTALLDYIKQNRPGDSEKYNMVALCFRMNREIAENLESAARTQLKLIAAQPWEKNKDLISKLQQVVTYFTDAAQSYTKESCPRQARTCIQMAKLVTLQLHFLKTERGIRIVNLTRDELPAIISALTKYYQVRTVAEAYRYSPCWAEVLHHHVVQNGNLAFLQEFEQHDNLTSNIFQDIVLLCKPDKVSLTIKEQSRLAELLQHCPDVSLASRIAWKCGLSDFAQQLLKVPGAKSYIQDVLNL